MQTRTRIAAIALTAGSMVGAAFADEAYDSGATAFYDYARVTHVEPIYREVPITTRVRECRDDGPYRAHRRSHSYTPAIVGGIVGGVVGNQFSHGRRRTVLTVAGAALGASLGHDIQRRQRLRHAYHRHADCSTVERIHYEREVEAYRVRYRYQGQTFTTVSREHPGRRLRLQVGVTPVGERYAAVGAGHRSCGIHRGDDYCEED